MIVLPSHHHFPLLFFFLSYRSHQYLHSFPTRRSSDLLIDYLAPFPAAPVHSLDDILDRGEYDKALERTFRLRNRPGSRETEENRSEEHTSELQSLAYLVCRLLLEKKKKNNKLDRTITN